MYDILDLNRLTEKFTIWNGCSFFILVLLYYLYLNFENELQELVGHYETGPL